MIAIATVWKSRAGLDAMRESGETTFARRVLREAGGEPDVTFFEIEAETGSSRGAQGQIQASNRAQRSCYPAETTFRAVCEMGLRAHFL